MVPSAGFASARLHGRSRHRCRGAGLHRLRAGWSSLSLSLREDDLQVEVGIGAGEPHCVQQAAEALAGSLARAVVAAPADEPDAKLGLADAEGQAGPPDLAIGQ